MLTIPGLSFVLPALVIPGLSLSGHLPISVDDVKCDPHSFVIANDTKYRLEPYSIDDGGPVDPGCRNVHAERFDPYSLESPQRTTINYPSAMIVDEYEVFDPDSGESLGIVGFNIRPSSDAAKDVFVPFSISDGRLAGLYFDRPTNGAQIIRSR